MKLASAQSVDAQLLSHSYIPVNTATPAPPNVLFFEPAEVPLDSFQYRVIKRLIDLTLAVLMAPVIFTIGLLLGVLIKINSPGPLFYRHRRIGQHGRTFYMWKFRTMRVDGDFLLEDYFADHPNAQLEWKRYHKLREDPRVTSLGRFLRRTSLDELPQILNVFEGNMSLVGPRPIVEAEVAKYQHRFYAYSCAKPGITGLWQVSGRCDVDYTMRTSLDEKYVITWSPLLDMKILVKTGRTVWRAHGAY